MKEAARRPLWVTVARVLLTLAALVGLAWWFLMSLVLFFFRCDEGCGRGDFDHWIYSGQFGVALLGCAFGVTGLALGFTPRRTRSWSCVLAAVVCFGFWVEMSSTAGL